MIIRHTTHILHIAGVADIRLPDPRDPGGHAALRPRRRVRSAGKQTRRRHRRGRERGCAISLGAGEADGRRVPERGAARVQDGTESRGVLMNCMTAASNLTYRKMIFFGKMHP